MKNSLPFTNQNYRSGVSKNDFSLKLKSLVFLVLILISSSFFSQTFTKTTVGNKVTLTSVGTGQSTWTVPCGVTSLTVEAWGAGGAGEGVEANGTPSKGGGAQVEVMSDHCTTLIRGKAILTPLAKVEILIKKEILQKEMPKVHGLMV